MTIYGIAKEAGVSISTVSRVINGGSCSPETKRRVYAVMERHGYQPNAIARGLASNRMMTIAIVMVDIRVGHYAHTAYELERFFHARHYEVLICNTGSDLADIKGDLEGLESRKVDGIFLLGSTFDRVQHDPGICRIIQSIPTVQANGNMHLAGVDTVRVDDAKGIRMVVDYLYGHGRRSIIYAQDVNTSSAEMKVRGYQEAMAVHHLPIHVLACDHSLEGGRDVVEQLTSMRVDYDAMVFGDDIPAVGAIKALKARGVAIPSQVAVTGFNNLKSARFTETELTSVDNKYWQLASESAQCMLARLEHRPVSIPVIEPELVIRQST